MGCVLIKDTQSSMGRDHVKTQQEVSSLHQNPVILEPYIKLSDSRSMINKGLLCIIIMQTGIF